MPIDRVTTLTAEAELYEIHRAALIRFATAVAGPDDAADIVSDAMLSLLNDGGLRVARNPVALMHRAVLSKARSMQRSGFRRRARERRFAERWIEEQPTIRPDVVSAVVSLSPRQRACVYLTYWADMSPKSVAEHLDISEGTVKKYLARARSNIREVLDE